MPLTKPEDYGAGDVNNHYCKYCTDAQGNLLPKEQVRQNMINFYNRTMGQSPEQAAVEVDKIMAKMPAWQEGNQLATPVASDQTSAPSIPPTPPMPPVGETTSVAVPTEMPAPEPSIPEPTVNEPQIEPVAEPSSKPAVTTPQEESETPTE